MKRVLVLVYGAVSYVTFLATFAYLFGFLGNVVVPKSIDSHSTPLTAFAVAVDVLLLMLFAIQHSVMARPTFKRWWTTIVPKPIERSTYLFFTNIALAILFWLWQPIDANIWNARHPLAVASLIGLFYAGWVIVFIASVLINHFDLFGLRQVWLYFRGRPYTRLPFKKPVFYRHVRHPLYVGWLLTVWATPTMTAGHLLFAVMTTAYILIAIRFEERNLLESHGSSYAAYRRAVPMLVPALIKRSAMNPRSGSDSD